MEKNSTSSTSPAALRHGANPAARKPVAAKRLRVPLVILATDAVTIAVVVIALNFMTGEKKIEQQVARLYSVDAPGFARARWGDLLEAGAEIYEYQPTMYHCKMMVVDALWVSVGSTNFDNRSFRLNDEANLNIYDAQFADRQIVQFRADLAHSRRITLAEWQPRPWHEKLWEHAASLVGGQL